MPESLIELAERVEGASRVKCPNCRNDSYAFYPCDQRGKLMMLGAANQWFPSTVNLLALPREEAAEVARVLADDLVPARDGREREFREDFDLFVERSAGHGGG